MTEALPLDVRRARDESPERVRPRTRLRGPASPRPSLRGIALRESRDDYDARVLAAVAATEPELVLLLGWMHVLPPAFIARFPQLLNVHPALLPFDPSLDAVTFPTARRCRRSADPTPSTMPWPRAAAGSGRGVHRVGVAVDRGQVIARAPLALVPGEERPALEGRLHALEHRVLEAALRRWAAEQP